MQSNVTRRAFLGVGLTTTAGLLLAACAKRVPGATLAPTATTFPTATTTPQATTLPTSVATAVPATSLPSCVVRPAQTEGPYFVDEKLNRADIRSDPSDSSVRPGLPLTLTIRTLRMQGSGCSPLSGALVDIWHCDAQGAYSDVAGTATAGKKFLRGYQLTDAAGTVRFTTIYPGWYPGRAVHIHFKIRLTAGYDLTSQLYFDEAVSDQVFSQAPYTRSGQRTPNSRDGLYGSGGPQLTLNTLRDGQGYAATFDIGLQV